MKLPAVWIFAAFASGAGVAMRWPGSLRLWAAAAAIAILAGVVFA